MLECFFILNITVNSEIFARILFSRIAIKYIFATFKIRDQGMIDIFLKRRKDLAILREFNFHETLRNNSLAKISEFTVS